MFRKYASTTEKFNLRDRVKWMQSERSLMRKWTELSRAGVRVGIGKFKVDEELYTLLDSAFSGGTYGNSRAVRPPAVVAPLPPIEVTSGASIGRDAPHPVRAPVTPKGPILPVNMVGVIGRGGPVVSWPLNASTGRPDSLGVGGVAGSGGQAGIVAMPLILQPMPGYPPAVSVVNGGGGSGAHGSSAPGAAAGTPPASVGTRHRPPSTATAAALDAAKASAAFAAMPGALTAGIGEVRMLNPNTPVGHLLQGVVTTPTGGTTPSALNAALGAAQRNGSVIADVSGGMPLGFAAPVIWQHPMLAAVRIAGATPLQDSVASGAKLKSSSASSASDGSISLGSDVNFASSAQADKVLQQRQHANRSANTATTLTTASTLTTAGVSDRLLGMEDGLALGARRSERRRAPPAVHDSSEWVTESDTLGSVSSSSSKKPSAKAASANQYPHHHVIPMLLSNLSTTPPPPALLHDGTAADVHDASSGHEKRPHRAYDAASHHLEGSGHAESTEGRVATGLAPFHFAAMEGIGMVPFPTGSSGSHALSRKRKHADAVADDGDERRTSASHPNSGRLTEGDSATLTKRSLQSQPESSRADGGDDNTGIISGRSQRSLHGGRGHIGGTLMPSSSVDTTVAAGADAAISGATAMLEGMSSPPTPVHHRSDRLHDSRVTPRDPSPLPHIVGATADGGSSQRSSAVTKAFAVLAHEATNAFSDAAARALELMAARIPAILREYGIADDEPLRAAATQLVSAAIASLSSSTTERVLHELDAHNPDDGSSSDGQARGPGSVGTFASPQLAPSSHGAQTVAPLHRHAAEAAADSASHSAWWPPSEAAASPPAPRITPSGAAVGDGREVRNAILAAFAASSPTPRLVIPHPSRDARAPTIGMDAPHVDMALSPRRRASMATRVPSDSMSGSDSARRAAYAQPSARSAGIVSPRGGATGSAPLDDDYLIASARMVMT